MKEGVGQPLIPAGGYSLFARDSEDSNALPAPTVRGDSYQYDLKDIYPPGVRGSAFIDCDPARIPMTRFHSSGGICTNDWLPSCSARGVEHVWWVRVLLA